MILQFKCLYKGGPKQGPRMGALFKKKIDKRLCAIVHCSLTSSFGRKKPQGLGHFRSFFSGKKIKTGRIINTFSVPIRSFT